MDVKDKITEVIKQELGQAKLRYREPVIGYAAANDPLFFQLDEKIGAAQYHPQTLLADAKTVVVYFLPFPKELVSAVRKEKRIVPLWSEYYTETNFLLEKIAQSLQVEFAQMGIHSKAEPPTENFDEISLTAQWAHKAAALIAGIGTMGLHHLLITRQGSAGRLGSIVIDRELTPSSRPEEPYCLFLKQGSCGICADRCPSGALTRQGYDRFRCNAYLDGKNIRDDQQGCGCCSSGPCAERAF